MFKHLADSLFNCYRII